MEAFTVILLFSLVITILIIAAQSSRIAKYELYPVKDEEIIIELATAKANIAQLEAVYKIQKEANEEVVKLLEFEKDKGAALLSQKKSSETRIGMISENLVPLLQGLPYTPSNLHHLSNPVDYIYFDYDNAEIILIEVKSGNSKESSRQKLIKNIVKQGKIYYEELRINEKGIKIKRADNNE